ncbi:MAG: AbrB/MazE/SpoVT family DNA-binding domain-containing protein, partial [Candidatus Saccharimonadales bacterium]
TNYAIDNSIITYILIYMSTNIVATQSLQKWGNSSGVRLPKKIIDAAKLKDQQLLTVSLKGRSIVLTPVKTTKALTLKEMLKGVTPKNVHGEFDWGLDVGAEIIDD